MKQKVEIALLVKRRGVSRPLYMIIFQMRMNATSESIIESTHQKYQTYHENYFQYFIIPSFDTFI